MANYSLETARGMDIGLRNLLEAKVPEAVAKWLISKDIKVVGAFSDLADKKDEIANFGISENRKARSVVVHCLLCRFSMKVEN